MSARGAAWCKYVAEHFRIVGVNAYLTKPKGKMVFDDKPNRLANRFAHARPLLSGDDWYKLGMKYLRWRKPKVGRPTGP